MSDSDISLSLGTALDKLSKLDFDYLIIGGLLCKSILGNHGRPVDDIDLICDTDFKKIEEMFKKQFDVVRFDYYSFSKVATEESFTSVIKINGENIIIEGRRFDIFNKIKKETYKIGNHSFKGVPIEFQIAEKIIAMFSVPVPSYKHLVDLYSFSLLDESVANRREIKRYFDLLLSYKNEIKKKLGLPILKSTHFVDPNQEFDGSFYLSSLQAQHNYSRDYLVNKINEWLSSLSI